MSDNTQNLVTGLMGTVNSNMVTGQAAVNLVSPAMGLTVDKAFTAAMSGSKYNDDPLLIFNQIFLILTCLKLLVVTIV